MLYLHCGWPRTSTTTLQVALFDHREQLAAAGALFPERWLAKAMPTHNGLADVLKAARQSDDPFDEFKSYLNDHAERDVLISAEFITTWILPIKQQDTLLGFLAAAREVVPTRCIWTMRRIDGAIRSLYLRRLALGYELPTPAEHSNRIRDLGGLFGGMQRMDDAMDGEVAYVKYDSRGSHYPELLDAFGISGEVRTSILAQLTATRLNVSVGHKQAVALLGVDALSARAGVELDRTLMGEAFHRGEFSFAEDWRCELVDGGVRRALHERALTDADRQGFTPYSQFFGEDEIQSSTVDLGLDALTDEDVERLASRFGRTRLGATSAA